MSASFHPHLKIEDLSCVGAFTLLVNLHNLGNFPMMSE